MHVNDLMLLTQHVCLQGSLAVLQRHAAIDKLLEALGGCQQSHGLVSIAALQCKRTVAQGHSLQGDHIKAQRELEDALKSMDTDSTSAAGPIPTAALVTKAGIMFELADVLDDLQR